jgi:hypothetical protein
MIMRACLEGGRRAEVLGLRAASADERARYATDSAAADEGGDDGPKGPVLDLVPDPSLDMPQTALISEANGSMYTSCLEGFEVTQEAASKEEVAHVTCVWGEYFW